MESIEKFLSHPVLWGVFAVVALAVTFSGKLSLQASATLVWAAVPLALVGVYRLTSGHDLLTKSLVTCGCGLLLCAGARGSMRWLAAKPVETASTVTPTTPLDLKQPLQTKQSSEPPVSKIQEAGPKPPRKVEPTKEAAQPPANPSKLIGLSAPNGIAIGGDNYGTNTVNNFGPLPAEPTFKQEGSRIIISSRAEYSSPNFVLIFDSPVIAGQIFHGGGASMDVGVGQINGHDGTPDPKTIWVFRSSPALSDEKPIIVNFSSELNAKLIDVHRGPPH